MKSARSQLGLSVLVAGGLLMDPTYLDLEAPAMPLPDRAASRIHRRGDLKF